VADRVSSTRVTLDERRLSNKPLAVRVIMSLVFLNIIREAVVVVFLLVMSFLPPSGSRSTVTFMDNLLKSVLERRDLTLDDFYAYVGGYISAPDIMYISSMYISLLMVLFVLIENKKLIWFRIIVGALIIAGATTISYDVIAIAIFLLSLTPSVSRYCQGVPPHMRVFLEYRGRKEESTLTRRQADNSDVFFTGQNHSRKPE
jgi:hypothetical protein